MTERSPIAGIRDLRGHLGLPLARRAREDRVMAANDELRAIAEAALSIGYLDGTWWSEDAEFMDPLDREEALHIAAWSPSRAIAACDLADAAKMHVRGSGVDRCERCEAPWPCAEAAALARWEAL